MKAIGYKQFIEYFNKEPIAYKRIKDVSCVNSCYYDPQAKKTNSKEEMLKRNKKYYFNLTVPSHGVRLQKHVYYYDSEKEASIHNKQLKLQLYDQLTKPFLRKIERGRRLTLTDEQRLMDILNSF